MKATDLMLGDWVFCDGKPFRINQIGDILCMENEDKSLLAYPEEVSPIPITPEILEENGWKNISDHTLKGCETFRLMIEQRGFDYRVQIKLRDYFRLDSYDDAYYTLCQMCYGCKFVHELQHALRLCGIEKEIII